MIFVTLLVKPSNGTVPLHTGSSILIAGEVNLTTIKYQMWSLWKNTNIDNTIGKFWVIKNCINVWLDSFWVQKFAKQMSGRFVCYLIIYKLFQLDSSIFFLAKFWFRSLWRSKFFENHAKRTCFVYAQYRRETSRAGNRVLAETFSLQCTNIVHMQSSICSDSGRNESFWRFWSFDSDKLYFRK